MKRPEPHETGWQERLYDAEAARLILYGRALGLSHGEAEDVLQDTFAALLQLGPEPDEPRYYALRAFRNRALNHKRTLWRRLRRELESEHWFERAESETPQERRAVSCLKRLPREQREVIVLKIWHGRTFEHIGRLLELSPHTAAGRYRYGMQKLKSCLKGTDHESIESTGEPIAFLETASTISGT